MCSAVLYGKCLYGGEVHFITNAHFKGMRDVLKASMGKEVTNRDCQPVLLLHKKGKHDPETARIVRLIRHWIKEHDYFEIPQEYWHSPAVNPKNGPIHLVKAILDQLEIQTQNAGRWLLNGSMRDIRSSHLAVETVRDKVLDQRWTTVCNHHTRYQGLQTGLDYEATHHYHKTLKEGKRKATLEIIQADAVYTPSKSHFR
jgi:hypothetical protein